MKKNNNYLDQIAEWLISNNISSQQFKSDPQKFIALAKKSLIIQDEDDRSIKNFIKL
jgi:hypothetical protein